MENIKEKTLALVNVHTVAKFVVLASIATVLPFFIHVQWLTGSIVNTILVLTLFMVGIRSAFLICLIPSMIALSGGLLPAVLAPVVPFIMLGNVIYVLFIDWAFKVSKETEKGYWLGLAVASSAKFVFLFLSVEVVSSLLLKQELSTKITQILSWPQLYTAFVGGMMAFIVLKVVNNFSKDKTL